MTQQNQEKYTRVTEILYPFSGLKHVDSYVLENAAARGTMVHSICEKIMRDQEPMIPQDLGGYIHSFRYWWQDGRDVMELEKRFWCDDLNITGQCDIIIRDGIDLIIIDLKTSASPSKTWPLQGSAYTYLAQKAGYNITKIQFLQLNRDGKEPRLHTYDYDFDFFKKCYDVYMYFFKSGKDGERR